MTHSDILAEKQWEVDESKAEQQAEPYVLKDTCVLTSALTEHVEYTVKRGFIRT